MKEYSIKLGPSQLRFLSDNFEYLVSETRKLKELMAPIPLDRDCYRSVDPNRPEDKRVLDYSQSRRVFERNSRATGVVRRLYGIIGFEKCFGSRGFYFHNFLIPEVNEDPVKEAIGTGVFSKEFPEEDLDILRVIYERNEQLRELGIKRRHPLFYASEISKLSGAPYKDVKDSLFRLVGLLGLCFEERSRLSDGEVAVYSTKRFMVPRAREDLILNLLNHRNEI